jgi:predicted RNA-binding protein with PUA-like domain
MAYWLLKTEPDEFSWDDQVKRGAKGESWTGVRNFTARGHMKEMKKGDHAFFYHTGDEKQIVGIVEVVKEAYPDPTDEKGVFKTLDVRAVKPVPKPVTLAAIKAEPKLKDMALVKYSRLSVQPSRGSPAPPGTWGSARSGPRRSGSPSKRCTRGATGRARTCRSSMRLLPSW